MFWHCTRLDGIEIVVLGRFGLLHGKLISPQREDRLDGVVIPALGSRRQPGEKEYNISWAHVELVAGLGKLKQAADAELKDHRVEMACRC
jgi:hypothetical protein